LKIYTHAFDFLLPYIEDTDGIDLVEDVHQVDFVLSMNNAGHDELVEQARDIAHGAGKPFCWWTIEDPNSCLYFLLQARLADYVFTSDREMIPWYRERLGHKQIYWLPLAAAPKYHHPLPLAEDVVSFSFSGNWYDGQNDARKWGSETVILPLAQAGHKMAIFSYEEPPYAALKSFWRGATSCRTVSEQYRSAYIALGNNNQRSGMDGIEKTVMCSMRVFESLACGKPFLSSATDAYEALGFENRKHLLWSNNPQETLEMADWLLNDGKHCAGLAEVGRELVLSNHLYKHRMERIEKAIGRKAGYDAFD
jgi:spore maturation protein CgeB